jgi:hypothetical protein
VLVPLPGDRALYADALGIAGSGLVDWKRRSYIRTVSGHKQRRTVEFASVGQLSSWDTFVQAAQKYGVSDPSLWVCLIREIEPTEQPLEETMALVSTRHLTDGIAALQALRPRWHIENDNYRELKEGFGLEEQRWGRDDAAAHCRTTLTLLAFNTAQVSRSRGGQREARLGIRRWRRLSRRELGHSPVVIFRDDGYGVMSLEQLLAAVGAAARHGLLPALQSPQPDCAHPP